MSTESTQQLHPRPSEVGVKAMRKMRSDMPRHENWLIFNEIPWHGTTKKWEVLSGFGGNTHLGVVAWYRPWRKYCFLPNAQTVFDTKCLAAVYAFISDQMQERK